MGAPSTVKPGAAAPSPARTARRDMQHGQRADCELIAAAGTRCRGPMGFLPLRRCFFMRAALPICQQGSSGSLQCHRSAFKRAARLAPATDTDPSPATGSQLVAGAIGGTRENEGLESALRSAFTCVS